MLTLPLDPSFIIIFDVMSAFDEFFFFSLVSFWLKIVERDEGGLSAGALNCCSKLVLDLGPGQDGTWAFIEVAIGDVTLVEFELSTVLLLTIDGGDPLFVAGLDEVDFDAEELAELEVSFRLGTGKFEVDPDKLELDIGRFT
jgi:hypothetical protein